MQLIEDSLSLFARPREPTWTELEEQEILIMVISIIKADETEKKDFDYLQDWARRFDVQVPDESMNAIVVDNRAAQNQVINPPTIFLTTKLLRFLPSHMGLVIAQAFQCWMIPSSIFLSQHPQMPMNSSTTWYVRNASNPLKIAHADRISTLGHSCQISV
jgi:hypothetical protein